MIDWARRNEEFDARMLAIVRARFGADVTIAGRRPHVNPRGRETGAILTLWTAPDPDVRRRMAESGLTIAEV